MSKTDLTKKEHEAEKILHQKLVFPGKQHSEFIIRFVGPEQTFDGKAVPKPVTFETIIGPRGASIILPEPEREKREPPIVHIIRECCCGRNHYGYPERGPEAEPLQYVTRKVHLSNKRGDGSSHQPLQRTSSNTCACGRAIHTRQW